VSSPRQLVARGRTSSANYEPQLEHRAAKITPARRAVAANHSTPIRRFLIDSGHSIPSRRAFCAKKFCCAQRRRRRTALMKKRAHARKFFVASSAK
jgi:hypothetical protein